MKQSEDRYNSGDYLAKNPSWDAQDSPWKAARIIKVLRNNEIMPNSICEVGCGAGGILASLRDYLGPACRLVGYDIATPLKEFWKKHDQKQIEFILGNFLKTGANDSYDILLLVDVIEHIENPFEFLRRTLNRASWFILHIPLDLHVSAALRNTPLLRARHQTGHLHYWNKDLALSILSDCGLQTLHWEYTAGTVELPTSLRFRKLARWPRKFFFGIAPDVAVRILGGYSLLVLAKPVN